MEVVLITFQKHYLILEEQTGVHYMPYDLVAGS